MSTKPTPKAQRSQAQIAMKTSNKAIAISKTDLAKIKTPSPTESWTPTPHHELFDRFTAEAQKRGYKLVGETHSIAHQGRRYFGIAHVEHKDLSGKDFRLLLGVRNSHDRTLAAAGLAGSYVLICSNGCFSAEEKFSQRHTKNIEEYLPAGIVSVVDRLAQRYKTQDERIRSYKKTELNNKDAHDFIIQSIDRGIISGSDVADVLKQWRTPDHKEFGEDLTVWRLFNAYTDGFKSVNPFDVPRRGQLLHELMDSASGFKLAKPEQVGKS